MKRDRMRSRRSCSVFRYACNGSRSISTGRTSCSTRRIVVLNRSPRRSRVSRMRSRMSRAHSRSGLQEPCVQTEVLGQSPVGIPVVPMGASLDVKLSYPAGSFGNDANVAKVEGDLPKQLPSRLTTLQKACPAAHSKRSRGVSGRRRSWV